jgi:hypothetical protein
MLKQLIVAAAAVVALGVATAVPVTEASAQGANACLRNNRIWSWDVRDNRTMVVTDRQRNDYLVRLSGGCVGLNTVLNRIAFRTATSLGCMQPGDRVIYREPSLGTMTCFVRSVEYLGNRRYNRAPDYAYSPGYDDYYDDRTYDDRGTYNRGYDARDRYDPYRR